MKLDLYYDLISIFIFLCPSYKIIEEINDIISKMRVSKCIYFEKNIPAINDYLLIIGLFNHDEVVDFVYVFKVSVYY